MTFAHIYIHLYEDLSPNTFISIHKYIHITCTQYIDLQFCIYSFVHRLMTIYKMGIIFHDCFIIKFITYLKRHLFIDLQHILFTYTFGIRLYIDVQKPRITIVGLYKYHTLLNHIIK